MRSLSVAFCERSAASPSLTLIRVTGRLDPALRGGQMPALVVDHAVDGDFHALEAASHVDDSGVFGLTYAVPTERLARRAVFGLRAGANMLDIPAPQQPPAGRAVPGALVDTADRLHTLEARRALAESDLAQTDDARARAGMAERSRDEAIARGPDESERRERLELTFDALADRLERLSALIVAERRAVKAAADDAVQVRADAEGAAHHEVRTVAEDRAAVVQTEEPQRQLDAPDTAAHHRAVVVAEQIEQLEGQLAAAVEGTVTLEAELRAARAQADERTLAAEQQRELAESAETPLTAARAGAQRRRDRVAAIERERDVPIAQHEAAVERLAEATATVEQVRGIAEQQVRAAVEAAESARAAAEERVVAPRTGAQEDRRESAEALGRVRAEANAARTLAEERLATAEAALADLAEARSARDAARELVHELADELLEQSTEIRRMSGELAEVLGADVTAGLHPTGAEFEAAGPPATPADTMRLVALDMLLAGRTRDQIHSYLRETFSEEDPQPVVEQVFADFDA